LHLQDPLFSNQEFRQIVGRVWRYPQQRQVIVYHLLALGAADTILQQIAGNKDKLLEAFVASSNVVAKSKPIKLLNSFILS
jgi:superfamily II DNA or RNA helicase